MDSVDLDMGEIFDEAEEEFPNITPLPDLPDNDIEGTQNNDDDAENNDVLAQLRDLSKGAAKKVVRRPQPKLDPDRLTGPRGIPILPKMFEDVKFKGKGHEAQDLKMVMRRLEHWSHRLFPCMPFDQILERIEKLGAKKQVQTCVKKMRLGMPLLDEEFVGDTNEENEDVDEDNLREARNKAVFPDLDDDNEMLEDIIAAEEGGAENLRSSHSPTFNSNVSKTVTTPSQPQGPPQPDPGSTPVNTGITTVPNGLTPDQIERMERNKRLAMEKRAARLRLKSPGTPLLSQRDSLSQHAASPSSKPSARDDAGRDTQSLDSSRKDISQPESISDSGKTDDSLCESHQPASDATNKNSLAAVVGETIPSSQSQGDNLNNSIEMSEIIPNQDEGYEEVCGSSAGKNEEKSNNANNCINGANVNKQDGDIALNKVTETICSLESNLNVDGNGKSMEIAICNGDEAVEASSVMDSEESCPTSQVIPNIDENERSVKLVSFNGEDSRGAVEKNMPMDTEESGSLQSQVIPNVDEYNKTVELNSCVVANGGVESDKATDSMDDQQTEDELKLFLDED